MNAGSLRLLGTTTPEGLRRLQEKEPTLVRSLTILSVEEPSIDGSTEILRGIAGRYEEHHRVRIAEGAIRAAVVLAKRYAQDRFLPDSAIDLLDESAATLRVEVDGAPAALDEATERLESLRTQIASLEGTDDAVSVETRQRLEQEASSVEVKAEEIRKQVQRHRTDATASGATPAEGAVLDAEHVARTLAVWTGIPVAKMLEGEAEKLLRMELRLERRVVGQSEAVRALARAVRRGRVGLRDPRRPIGSFLFLGPSGVGKTELAKALAEFLFDDEAALTRLDMSEFMERHMAQRLLGAPPGYADSEQGGFLTEAVRRRPYSVLLFDEVEKAHQDVFNLLLQVLDDGRLTDGRGRLADFTNTVVIMTSNIGSDRILEADPKLFEHEEGREALRDVLTDQLGRFFRPEFLNRVDDVIVFRPLSRGDLRAIVDIQLDYVRRLLEPRGVKLDVEDGAKDALVDMAYQPALGARPLRLAIVHHVQDPLAEALLKGGFGTGVTIRVSFKDGEFCFAPA
jgi:ATP-dependent Clp protease ATP-binding subunit ClpB